MKRTRKVFRHLSFMVSSNLFNMLAALVSMYFYTRILSPDELALIPISVILSTLVYAISNLGLGLFVQRRLPELTERQPTLALQLSRSYVLVTMAGVFLCCLFLVASSESVAALLLKDSGLSWQILLLIPSVVVYCWWTCLSLILMGKGMFERFSVLSIALQALHPITVILMYLYYGVAGMVLGLALGRGVVCLFATFYIKKSCFGKMSLKQARAFIKESWPFYVEGFVNYPVSYADQWIIGIFLTPVDLAIYFIPRTMYDKLHSISNAFSSVMLTNMSQMVARGTDAAKDCFFMVRRLCFFVFTPMSVALLSTSFFIIDLLAGPKYHAGVIPFCIFILLFWVEGIITAYSLGVMTMAPPRARLYVVLIQSAVLLSVLPALCWFVKVNGVVLARVFSKVSSGIASRGYLRRLFDFSMDRDAIRAVLLPSAFLIIVSGGSQLFYYNRFVAPMYLALGLAFYGLMFLRNITEADMQAIEDIFPESLSWSVSIARRWRNESFGIFKL